MNYYTIESSELIKIYKSYQIQKEELISDINDTFKALEDSKIDFLTRKEFKDDIANDKCQLSNINFEMKKIETAALERRISLIEENKKTK